MLRKNSLISQYPWESQSCIYLSVLLSNLIGKHVKDIMTLYNTFNVWSHKLVHLHPPFYSAFLTRITHVHSNFINYSDSFKTWSKIYFLIRCYLTPYLQHLDYLGYSMYLLIMHFFTHFFWTSCRETEYRVAINHKRAAKSNWVGGGGWGQRIEKKGNLNLLRLGDTDTLTHYNFTTV